MTACLGIQLKPFSKMNMASQTWCCQLLTTALCVQNLITQGTRTTLFSTGALCLLLSYTPRP